jgi:hypothetical protein
MEDFKDVMLSEPPPRYAGASAAAPTTSNALSLESYKGILLCDRPADIRDARRGPQNAPFLPPGNPEMDRGNGNLGLQPSMEARAKNALTRSSRGDLQGRAKNAALSKHRKWLQSFASEMKKMQEEKTNAQIRQSMREGTLRDREATKRREGTYTADGDSNAAVVAAPSTPPQGSDAAAAKSSKKPPAGASTKTAKSGGGKAKPKWAMTEEEAEDAEFAEARSLVDFAAELDYDAFIKDFEVQEALAIMRDRVKEIAAEKGIDLEAARRERIAAGDGASDDDDDAASVITTASTTTREIRRAAKTAAKRRASEEEGAGGAEEGRTAWDNSTSTALRKALAGDALKLAERVLQTSEHLRKVHSKLSMARLLEDVAMELDNGKTQRQVTLPREAVIIPPRIAMVAAEATGTHGSTAAQPQKRVLTDMRHSKTQAQNLPYLYRCPSI